MNKKLIVLCLLLIAIYPLRAGVVVTGAINSGNHVNGMFNSTSTTMTITIRLNDVGTSDATNDAGGAGYSAKIYHKSHTSAPAANTITNIGNGFFPQAQTADNNLATNPQFFTTDGADRILVYTFDASDLSRVAGFEPEGQYIDFLIEILALDDTKHEVGFIGSDALYYDRIGPQIADEGWASLSSQDSWDSPTWITPDGKDGIPGNENNTTLYFNKKKIKFKLTETLGSAGGTSLIKFFGNDNGEKTYTIESDYFTGAADDPPTHTVADPTLGGGN